MAWSLRTPIGAELDLASQACEETLLSHLYQRLVRYTEQNVRHAVRLDHAPADGTDEPHPLVHVLVSNQGRDALDELIERESAATLDADLTAHGSLAAAYLHLLDHFDSRMAAVADHLLISKSYAYRCCARARLLSTHLQHFRFRSRIQDTFQALGAAFGCTGHLFNCRSTSTTNFFAEPIASTERPPWVHGDDDRSSFRWRAYVQKTFWRHDRSSATR